MSSVYIYMSGGVSKRKLMALGVEQDGGGPNKYGPPSLIGRPTYMMNYLRRRTVRPVVAAAVKDNYYLKFQPHADAIHDLGAHPCAARRRHRDRCG